MRITKKKFRKFHDPADKYDYEQLVKQVKQSVTKLMNDYIHKNLDKSCNDSKKKFKVLNKLLGTKKSTFLLMKMMSCSAKTLNHFFAPKLKIFMKELLKKLL